MASKKPNIGHLHLEQVAAIRGGLAPLYHSVGHMIRGHIESGEWQVEQQIPSERALMEMLGVSRATVRQGVENLVKEGVLYRVRGKGTFVAPPKVQQGVLRLLDFADTMRRSGLAPGARLLGKRRLKPPSNVRQNLNLGLNDEVIWFQRLLSVNGEPVLIESCYVPAARFGHLMEDYAGEEDLRAYLTGRFSVQIVRDREVFEPVILESAEAEVLGVKSGFPALWVEHVASDSMGHPVAFVTSLMRGDRCRFYTDLTLG